MIKIFPRIINQFLLEVIPYHYYSNLPQGRQVVSLLITDGKGTGQVAPFFLNGRFFLKSINIFRCRGKVTVRRCPLIYIFFCHSKFIILCCDTSNYRRKGS